MQNSAQSHDTFGLKQRKIWSDFFETYPLAGKWCSAVFIDLVLVVQPCSAHYLLCTVRPDAAAGYTTVHYLVRNNG